MLRPVTGLLLLVLLTSACAGAKRKVDSETTDPQTNYAKAESFMSSRQYGKALARFQMVNTTQDRELRAQVHLRMADAYFEKGGVLNLAEAQGRYQTFLNAFPLSDQASYAQYRFAQCLQRQINKPERDQTPTYQAMGEYRKVEELYPNSPWVDEARAGLAELEDHLSRDALRKVRFYYRRKSFSAAIDRLRDLLLANPDWEGQDEALYLMGMSLRRSGRLDEGDRYLRQAAADFPETEFGRKAQRMAGRPVPALEQPGDGTAG